MVVQFTEEMKTFMPKKALTHIVKFSNGRIESDFGREKDAEQRFVYVGNENLFWSPNGFTFKRENDRPVIRADIKHLCALTTLYADLDYEKISRYADLSPEEMLQVLVDDVFSFGILDMPNMVIASGHGLHLYWKIEETIKMQEANWRAVQDYIHFVLEEYGSDKQVASNPVSLLRLPNSVNRKPFREPVACRIIYFQKPEQEPTLKELAAKYNVIMNEEDVFYSTEDKYGNIHECIMFDEYLPTDKKTQELFFEQIDRKRALKAAEKSDAVSRYFRTASANIEEGVAFSKSISKNNLCLERNRRLKALLKLRDNGGSIEGCREVAFFLMRINCNLAWGNAEKSVSYIREVNESLRHPLPDSELIRATRSADKVLSEKMSRGKHIYANITDRWYIEHLRITPQEAELIGGFYSTKQKKAMKKLYDRQRYLEKHQISKHDSIRTRNIDILLAFVKKEMTKEQLADRFNVSVSTIARVLKQIQAAISVLKDKKKHGWLTKAETIDLNTVKLIYQEMTEILLLLQSEQDSFEDTVRLFKDVAESGINLESL